MLHLPYLCLYQARECRRDVHQVEEHIRGVRQWKLQALLEVMLGAALPHARPMWCIVRHGMVRALIFSPVVSHVQMKSGFVPIGWSSCFVVFLHITRRLGPHLLAIHRLKTVIG